eukprot:m.272579 g.272579  ORF g.272579 m.272579 type:complete len:325 (+) comp40565_c2_seq14:347-1321(+)
MSSASDLAETIRSVHASLREKLRNESADLVWKEHCEDKSTLEVYRSAMKTLATDHWEQTDGKTRITWCLAQCDAYFKDGGLEKSIAKDERRFEFYQKLGNEKASYEQLCHIIRTSTPDHLQSGSGRAKLRLLDVGSCYNPFSVASDAFEVTAMDINPAAEAVLTGDFLNINCLPPLEEKADLNIDRSRQLSSLPSQHFDVVVFCLLLSYMPSPHQRWTCCMKAHKLLRLHGLLLIVTPDSKHQNKNAPMVSEWKTSIESIGYQRWRYTKQAHAHCMAFRKIPVPDGMVRQKVKDMLRLPQEMKSARERLNLSTTKKYKDNVDTA